MEVLLERPAGACSACLIGSRAQGPGAGRPRVSRTVRYTRRPFLGQLITMTPGSWRNSRRTVSSFTFRRSATSATVKTTSGTEFVPTTEAYGVRTRGARRPTTLSGGPHRQRWRGTGPRVLYLKCTWCRDFWRFRRFLQLILRQVLDGGADARSSPGAALLYPTMHAWRTSRLAGTLSPSP
jgi:hypothetical protein